MRKISITLLLFICICLSSCGSGLDNEKESRENVEICNVEVYLAAINDNYVYHVDYPNQYYQIVNNQKELGYTVHQYLNSCIQPEDLTNDQKNYLLNFTFDLPETSISNSEPLAYEIKILYKDQSDELQAVSRYGYNDFPEGFEEFVTFLNDIYGKKLLPENLVLLEVTPRFLEEAFGVDSDDTKEGTLQNLIAVQNISIQSISNNFDMRNTLDSYLQKIQEDDNLIYRTDQLLCVESTSEEYEQFIKEFLENKKPEEYMEITSDQKNLRRFISTGTGKGFYIGRSNELDTMGYEQLQGIGYKIILDLHMEGMSYSADFYYDDSGKFVLIPDEDNKQIIKTFCKKGL